MDKYIKKEEAIRALLNDAPEQVGYSREDAADCIRYMDAADVAPVRHGQWIYDKKAQRPYCSVCKGYFYGATNSPMSYCPNCGTKMDGDDSDEAD